MLNIGIEVMLIVSQKKRSAELDDTDGLLAHWLAPIGTAMESKRARRHGLWTRPSVSRSLSPHRHELPGYGLRSDCESVLAGGSGDRFFASQHLKVLWLRFAYRSDERGSRGEVRPLYEAGV